MHLRAKRATYIYLKLRAKRAMYMRWSSGREATARSAPPARASPKLAGVAGHLASVNKAILIQGSRVKPFLKSCLVVEMSCVVLPKLDQNCSNLSKNSK